MMMMMMLLSKDAHVALGGHYVGKAQAMRVAWRGRRCAVQDHHYYYYCYYVTLRILAQMGDMIWI